MARTVSTRLMLDIGGFLGPLKVAAAGTREFGREFDQAATAGAKGVDKLSKGALIAGGGILAGFGLAVNSAMKFDKQMSATGAAAGTTGKQLDALRNAAMQAGADTAFSATEAANAEEELAKAGVSVKDILGGGLKGALDLAAAGQLDVGQAAEIAATAMTQFRLSGDKVPHVADLLSAAANKAQGSVQDVGMALKQGGLVASQFGLSIEETTGGLAAFAKAGLIGSDAGTSLKTMLLALANPSVESASLMKQLGINAYDAQGRFVGLAGLAGQLRSRLSGLTQAQRDQALAQIFGNDAVRAANVLYRNGADGINKWTNEVNDAGAATRTANQKMNNLSGDLERLKGSLETALIKTGSKSTGVLRSLAQTAEHSVNGFMQLPGWVQSTATALVFATGVTLTAAGAYGTLAPKVREARDALSGMGPAGAKANDILGKLGKTAGYVALAIAGLEVVAAVSNKIYEATGNATPTVEDLTVALREYAATGKMAGSASQIFGQDFSKMGEDLGLSIGKTSNLTLKFARSWSSLSENLASAVGFENIAGPFDDANRKIKAADQSLAQMVQSGNGAAAAEIFKGISAAAARNGVSLDDLKKKYPDYTAAAKSAQVGTLEAANSMGSAAGQARVLAGGMAAAVQEAGSLAEAIKGLNDINISAAEAGIKYQIGLNGMTAALRANKSAWNGSSTAAQQNHQVVIDQIKTAEDLLGKKYEEIKGIRGEGAANQWAAGTYAHMRAQIINAAVAAGINRQAVTAMVNQLFRVPKDTPARVSTPGAKQSAVDVAAVRNRIAELKSKQVSIAESGAPNAARRIWALQQQINALQKHITITTVFRTIGGVPTPAQGAGGNRRGVFRWGGINHAASGRLDAHMVDAPTVLYGERETGGEAFIPRLGDPARSRKYINTAASWYGGTVSYGRYAGAFTGGGSRGGDTHFNLTAVFSGPVGSRIQMDNWLTESFDRLRRRGRV